MIGDSMLSASNTWHESITERESITDRALDFVDLNGPLVGWWMGWSILQLVCLTETLTEDTDLKNLESANHPWTNNTKKQKHS